MSYDWDQLAERHGGYFATAHAYDAGFGRYDLAAAIRERQLQRLRRGVYVVASQHQQRTEQQRHIVLARAVMAGLGANVALTHQSASALYGHDQWGWDMSIVHVTRLDGNAGRLEANVQHHSGQLRARDLTEVDGLLTVVEDRAVVESTVELGVELGLCIVDACLRAGRVPQAALIERAERIPAWPRSRAARLAVRLGNGRAATVGETRCRYLFWRSGLPPAELQWEVRDRSGHRVAITDFGWPEAGHVGEFDGRRKYLRDLRPGEEPADAVFREKRREDSIRASDDLGVSRVIWTELSPTLRIATGKRVAAEIRRSQGRRSRYAVVIA